MTWLPLPAGEGSERERLLGLLPEVARTHRDFLEACEGFDGGRVVALCRARLALLLDCREELARHDPALLEELRDPARSAAFTPLERLVLEFAEQFLLDPARVEPELLRKLEALRGPSYVIDLAAALTGVEASLRLAALFDLEPAP